MALVQVNKSETAMAGTDNELDCKKIDDGMTTAEATNTASGAYCVHLSLCVHSTGFSYLIHPLTFVRLWSLLLHVRPASRLKLVAASPMV